MTSNQDAIMEALFGPSMSLQEREGGGYTPPIGTSIAVDSLTDMQTRLMQEYVDADIEMTEKLYNRQRENNMTVELDDLTYVREEILERRLSELERSFNKVDKNKKVSARYRAARMSLLQAKMDAIVEELDDRAKLQSRIDTLLEMEKSWSAKDTVLLFQRNFGKSEGWCYTYAAVKVAEDKWYITGRSASRGMTYEELVRNHLLLAMQETGEVWAASEWMQVKV